MELKKTGENKYEVVPFANRANVAAALESLADDISDLDPDNIEGATLNFLGPDGVSLRLESSEDAVAMADVLSFVAEILRYRN